jgi:hypothetical protein
MNHCSITQETYQANSLVRSVDGQESNSLVLLNVQQLVALAVDCSIVAE